MKPLVLCILDGCGVREESDGNAFLNANSSKWCLRGNNFFHIFHSCDRLLYINFINIQVVNK